VDVKLIPGASLLAVEIVGTQPLLVSSANAVMRPGTLGKRLAELTKLRRRTAADDADLRKVKFLLALYFDPKLGPYLPGYNLWVSVRNGAQFSRRGKDFERGCIVIEDKLPIQYDGPRDPEELYVAGNFCDVRPARLKGTTMIEAVRPIFPEWKLRATLAVNDRFIDVSSVKEAIEIAGLTEGLGTWRKRFGRFEVSFGEAKEEMKKAA
jgi:hypothetical protein